MVVTSDAEVADRIRLLRSRTELDAIAGLVPTVRGHPDLCSANRLFTVVLDESIDRDSFRSFLAQAGVQTSVHYPPVHRFSIYRRPSIGLPFSDAYGARTVALPLFGHITEEQVGVVVEAIRQAVPFRHSRLSEPLNHTLRQLKISARAALAFGGSSSMAASDA